ncbi:MAG: leucine--tRNA ligase [Candidatus Nealsonbacteria bacterium]|nr:leucine--tRNA ligase [Candidatus Nealsonbacteria bacterium]
MPRYNPAALEPKWQDFWQQNRVFAAPRLPQGPKLYVLDMFPYPSGNGLHVGHPEGYTATDIVCRYNRMRGRSVLHPMGWDAFGLPAEQHAKKTGTHPRTTTEANIDNFRRQLKMLGFSYDWDRELATTDVNYFRWTQFIFLKLFDTWFDPQQQRGRPIAELPIPDDVEGEAAAAIYRDEHRLAYQLEAPVNWCPALGTVLSNEEVVGGLSERGSHPVMRIPLRQWMLRITAYADRLENDLEGLDWSDSIKALQRNWIGRSTGAEVDFFIGTMGTDDGMPLTGEYEGWQTDRTAAGYPRKPGDEVLRIYTTRPDTLFGATYMVIAPEHPFVERLTRAEHADTVRAYCEEAGRKSDLDRTDLAKGKTGVFTGSYAINPVSDEAIPIWVADYVLISYGTGAIMAVPAHDTRDFEFAVEFGLPITAVVDPGEGADIPRDELLAGKVAFIADGTAINSGPYDGLSTPEFKKKIAADLDTKGQGRSAVNYKLRDWLFSRQHFWGEPFPILHELDDRGKPTGVVRALEPDDLPLDLPEDMKFDASHDSPEPPLDSAPDDWLYVTLDGKRYKRETNTMPQWAGSCWYYLRFLDPKNDEVLIDPEVEKAWMPVDLYVGGAEHAVLHLLYARFWHKVLYDYGYVSTAEPFQKLVNQGMILGQMEFTARQWPDGTFYHQAEWTSDITPEGNYVKPGSLPTTTVKVPANKVKKHGENFVWQDHPEAYVDNRSYKMSKSRGNVINPDEVVAEYGADSLRLYEMFMGPLESVKPWSMEGVSGVRGFLDRVWRMIIDARAETIVLNAAVQDIEPSAEQNRMLHKTIKAVTEDLDQMAFNTAIARMMEFTNFFTKEDPRPRSAMEQFVQLLSPFAPHICEELWQALGRDETLTLHPWPEFDESAIKEDTIEIPVQILGKLRSRIRVPADADRAALEKAAREDPRIIELVADKTIVKAIVIPGRMVNFVVK